MNDTAREFGSALGIAVLGSVLNSVYRSDVTAAVGDLPQQAAAAIESSIAAAGQIGEQLGPNGAQIIAAANEAFVSGAAGALRVAAAVVVIGALFVFLRAPRRGEH